MNIFVFDQDFTTNAQYHCDKHVVKMITEYAQLLSGAVRSTGVDAGYKQTHMSHPCAIWARFSIENYEWLCKLTIAVHKEWQYRYNHPANHYHKAFKVAALLPWPELPSRGMTPFAQAMPSEYSIPHNAITAYRNYFNGEKQHIASWTNRNQPEWYHE